MTQHSTVPAPNETANKGCFAGHCLCGGIVYEFEKVTPESLPNANICMCHCSICRHAIGTSCIPSIALPIKRLIYHKKDTLAWYASSKSVDRGFCTQCGCTVLFRYDEKIEPNTIWITVATLNETFQSSKEFTYLFQTSKYVSHISCDSMQPWEKIAYVIKDNDDGSNMTDKLDGWIVDSCAPVATTEETAKHIRSRI